MGCLVTRGQDKISIKAHHLVLPFIFDFSPSCFRASLTHWTAVFCQSTTDRAATRSEASIHRLFSGCRHPSLILFACTGRTAFPSAPFTYWCNFIVYLTCDRHRAGRRLLPTAKRNNEDGCCHHSVIDCCDSYLFLIPFSFCRLWAATSSSMGRSGDQQHHGPHPNISHSTAVWPDPRCIKQLAFWRALRRVRHVQLQQLRSSCWSTAISLLQHPAERRRRRTTGHNQPNGNRINWQIRQFVRFQWRIWSGLLQVWIQHRRTSRCTHPHQLLLPLLLDIDGRSTATECRSTGGWWRIQWDCQPSVAPRWM